MYTLKVKIFLSREDFCIEEFDEDAITIQLPTLPHIGDQIFRQDVLSLVKKFYSKEFVSGKDICGFDETPSVFSYVNSIAYGDDDIIYLGLGHAPSSYVACVYDLDDEDKKLYWTIYGSVPRIGESVSYPEKFGLEKSYRKIYDIAPAFDGIIIGTCDKLQTEIPVVINDIVRTRVENEVGTRVKNIVRVDAPDYIDVRVINNHPIDVELVNTYPVNVRVDGKVDVDVQNVKGYVYTREYSY